MTAVSPTAARRAAFFLLLAATAAGCGPGADAPAGPGTPAATMLSVTEPTTAPLLRPGAAVREAERLDLEAGQPGVERSGQLAAGGVATFVLSADAGQFLEIEVRSADDAVLPAVTGDDGLGLKYHTDGSVDWQGPVPATQDYHVALVNAAAGDRAFGLAVRLRDAAAPADRRSEGADEAVALFAGAARVAVRDLPPGSGPTARFAVRSEGGEVLVAAVAAAAGRPSLTLRDPSGGSVPGASPGRFAGELPLDGTYVLEVAGLPDEARAALSARLVEPRLVADGAQVVPPAEGEGGARIAGEIALGAGAWGGGRYRLDAAPGSRLALEILAPADGTTGTATVWGEDGRIVGALAVPGGGEPRALPGLPGPCTVSLLFDGGASGRTVRYEARLTVE